MRIVHPSIKATGVSLLVLIGASLVTGFLFRLVDLAALNEHFNAVALLALNLARLLPPDALPRTAVGGRGFGSRLYHSTLPYYHVLDASIFAGLIILLFAAVTYVVVVRFGAARYIRAAGRDDPMLTVSPLRSAIRSASLRRSAVMIMLTVPVACFSFRLWKDVDYHLSDINIKAINNVLTASSLADGVGMLGQVLVTLATIAMTLVTSIWWVDHRARRLAERARITEVVCGSCGYAKQGRTPSAPCPECGQMDAPLPSPLLRTSTFVVLAATLVFTVTMGPLVVGLVVGLFQE